MTGASVGVIGAGVGVTGANVGVIGADVGVTGDNVGVIGGDNGVTGLAATSQRALEHLGPVSV